MTLLELLVKELPKRGGWPDGQSRAWVDEGFISFSSMRRFMVIPDEYKIISTVKIEFVLREQYEAALAASKQEWNGEGLPPVECECEVKIGGDYFNLCRVVYSDDSCGVAFVYLGGDDEKYCGQIDCVSAKAAINYFRPIRSEEDKKRDEAIESITSLIEYRNGCHAKALSKWIFEEIAAGKIPGVKLED